MFINIIDAESVVMILLAITDRVV